MPSFSVDTHVFRELGELLVGRDSMALVELIKNAYDADATEVVVYGEKLDDLEHGLIRVADLMREKQLLIDFLCANAGGPMYYRGWDMQLSHRGMGIGESDWKVFLGHAAATLAKFEVPEAEQREVVAFVEGLKKDIVE